MVEIVSLKKVVKEGRRSQEKEEIAVDCCCCRRREVTAVNSARIAPHPP